ncbi:tRNA 2-thiouridine(34) synthase MnmA [Saccharicrinis aurantiacus]|uniref:tRNA 2-thiouridine(34) synthase MnmA n=1 Tax=Saccharicrinis aurantiacus TaxID=1849719 RepID=UPI00249325E4|nr:tRNA 2-thiouridine(34) synthase MnmA [Saccharicrinis aurantiacus]
MRKRVLLGMSGGVDSSMCAWYLQQMNFEVVGITFNTLSPLSSEKSTQFIQDAKDLAAKLKIEHHTIDVYDDFKREIIDYFVDEYAQGRTPNPCVRCNVTIKWKLLLEYATTYNCDKIATGHYVDIAVRNEFYHIKKGQDPSKDQSYFLWNLSQEILSRCVFPLAKYNKKEVKLKAAELGFARVSTKKESMGVCFLQGEDYRDYIKTNKPESTGNIPGCIVNESGEKIGTHEGVAHYTIGQKRGLNLEQNHGEYVAKINANENTLITSPKNKLMSDSIIIDDFMSCDPNYFNRVQKADARIRGLDAVAPTPCTINKVENKLHIKFSEPVWALTPGQSVVFYKNDIVMGGGFVNEVEFK